MVETTLDQLIKERKRTTSRGTGRVRGAEPKPSTDNFTNSYVSNEGDAGLATLARPFLLYKKNPSYGFTSGDTPLIVTG